MILTTTNAGYNLKSSKPFVFAPAAQTPSRRVISLSEIRRAAVRIAPYVKRTPCLRDNALSARFDSNFYLKLELLQNTGAFKVRGAFNKLLSLTAAEKQRGIVAVSGGNHAQAVAFAAQTLGYRSLILMPEITPRNYIEKTLSYGARVELFPSMADAFRRAEEYERDGLAYVHPFDDEAVVEGQGTIGLEIFEDCPQVTDVVVSIGGGGLAGGVAAALKTLKPDVKVWGVETRGADSMAKALAAGEIVSLAEITSIARTLGAPAVSRLTFDLACEFLSGVTIVEDAEAVREMFFLLDCAKILTEPAASCTLAAAQTLRENFAPESHVVLILCGGNIGLESLFELRSSGAGAAV